MLGLPAVLTGATGMDQYGFYTLDPVASRPWPLALSLVFSALSAGAGYLAYLLLQRRAWFAGNRYEAYQRNAIIFGAPVAVAFLPAFFLTGYNGKPLVLGIAGIMATSLCLTAALSDRKTRLDAGMARILFVVCVAIILVLLTLSVSGMLAMYFIEHSPSGGNFFWTWKFAWSDLGYPAEEFSQRYRNGLLAFGIAGSCYMTVAIGGSLLGAILKWARLDTAAALEPEALEPLAAAGGPEAVEEPLEEEPEAPNDPPAFLAVMNGREEPITREQYEGLITDKNRLPAETALLVDKASGVAFAKSGNNWRKIPFRGRRKGPFLLLCVYARHPGRRFTSSELEVLLGEDLSGRDGFNVSDFFAQLQKRNPMVPVCRDDHGTYLPATVKVCFLDHWLEPVSEDDAAPPVEQVTPARQSA